MALNTVDTIDVALVQQLLADQFPQWADLPITPAEPQGWDNRTFRLGEAMSVRLPSAEGYVPQVEKEHRWLPALAPQVPLPIPVPLARGVASDSYPFPWSVYSWISGEAASSARIADMRLFARELAGFLAALQRVDATGGPAPEPSNGFRGGPLVVYDAEARDAIAALEDEINTTAATALWEAALVTRWQDAPVWIHGDVAAGNLLVRDGRLHAVIDFGTCAVGDPACDTVIAWTFLEGESRAAFQAALPVDEATWLRGRGWALWKALITLVGSRTTNPARAAEARRIIDVVLADTEA